LVGAPFLFNGITTKGLPSPEARLKIAISLRRVATKPQNLPYR
jgi:hypothetical protein